MAAVDIGAQLKGLMELQVVDKQLYDLRRQRQAKPVQIASLNAARQAEQQQVTLLEQSLKALQVRRGGMEGDLSAKEAAVKKLQGQLYQVKTNKEYTVLQHEIAGAKADNSVLEEEILKLMERIDQQKAAIADAKTALEGKAAQVRAAVAAVEQEIAALDEAIAGRQSQRQTLAPHVDRTILAQYERVMAKKEGVGLVPIRGEVCGGCHMNIPPQQINEVRLQERLIACESCARLLYAPHDAAAA